MLRSLAPLACLLLPLARANDAGAAEVELVHAPAPGTARVIDIETTLELDGGELSCVMDDGEVPAMYLPQINMQMTDFHNLELTETYAADAWQRSYDEADWENAGTMTMIMEGNEQSFPWSISPEGPLEGRVVRLAPEDDGSIARSFADDGHANDELLEGLQADLGLTGLLPDGPVAEGASWSADGAALAVLLDPIGEAQWDVPSEWAQHMQPDFRERTVEGELEVVLRDVSDDGTRATCAVRGTLTRITVQPGDLSQVPVVDGTATDTVTETWDVEGELVWDLAANAVASLDLDGDFDQVTVTVKDPDQPGSSYEGTFAVAGSYSITVEAEEVGASAQ